MLRRRYFTAFSHCCELGDRRVVNQDRVFARQGEIGGCLAGIFLVADGCGGLRHGEKISQLLADSFAVIWDQELPRLLTTAHWSDEKILTAAVGWAERINETAYAFGQQTGERVGSTMSLLMTLDDRYYILNTGDSRVYLRRGESFQRLTEDQSVVADMLRNREITPEEAERATFQNALTMCVGYFRQLRPFLARGRLRRGDLFLLCSDGLYRGLGEERLPACLPDRVTEASARQLRACIPPGGAEDNVTALLVEILF